MHLQAWFMILNFEVAYSTVLDCNITYNDRGNLTVAMDTNVTSDPNNSMRTKSAVLPAKDPSSSLRQNRYLSSHTSQGHNNDVS